MKVFLLYIDDSLQGVYEDKDYAKELLEVERKKNKFYLFEKHNWIETFTTIKRR